MEQKGRKILASGNVFVWTHRRNGSRGGIEGHFTSWPSEADQVEAKTFSLSLKPEAAQTVIMETATGERGRAHRALLDNFIDGGSRN